MTRDTNSQDAVEEENRQTDSANGSSEGLDFSRREVMKAGGVVGLATLIGGSGVAGSTGTVSAASTSQGESVRAYLSSDTSIASSSGKEIVLDSESFDTNGNFDTSTGEYTAPSSGTYLIQWHATMAEPNDGSKLSLNILVNGSTATQQLVTAGAADTLSGHAIDMLSLSSGDTIKFNVWHNSSESETLLGDSYFTFAAIHQLGSAASGGSSGVPTQLSHEPTTTKENIISQRNFLSNDHQEVWVNPTGSDSNPGTESQPYATLQRAFRDIPYWLMHDFIINIAPGTNSNDQDAVNMPPVRANYSKGFGEIRIVGDSSAPENYVIDGPAWIGSSVIGCHPGNFMFEGVTLNSKIQSYHGVQYLKSCHCNSDTQPSNQSVIGGYSNISILEDCTIGGNADYVQGAKQGARAIMRKCDGSVNTSLMMGTGTSNQLFLDNDSVSGPHLDLEGFPGLIVENANLLYPNGFGSLSVSN